MALRLLQTLVTADTINANNSFRGAQQAWDSNDERDVDFRLSRTMSLTTVARGSLAHFSVRSILDRYTLRRSCAGDGPASVPRRARVSVLGRERRDPGLR